MTQYLRSLILGLILGAVLNAWTNQQNHSVPLALTDAQQKSTAALPHTAALTFPDEASFFLTPPASSNWLDATQLQITITWPEGAPRYSGAMVWLKDRDDFWHQYVHPTHLSANATNHIHIPLDSQARGWQTPGHSVQWHHRVKVNPQSFGLRFFADTAFTGRCELVAANLILQHTHEPPKISNIRPRTRQPRVLECYEARFDLPDRYANPFNPEQIDAGAMITTPTGQTNTIHAFYYQPHYRLEDEVNATVEPDGAPEWRIRYCPQETGTYTVTLYARDHHGSSTLTNALTFTAQAATPQALRFVRVSQRDRRYFEFDDTTLFYPIGHNTRSATDARMDDKFPWRIRQDEGTVAFRRYFQRMQEAGENFAEIWMSAWSLGLEWCEGIDKYHGANEYHMGNAWELDRVVELAAEHRIYLNLVLNHHGRMSTWSDPEWHLHPYNKTTAGGWLEQPLQFFSDARAIEMQKRFCRYTHARWGWAPVIFGYELCSELNLTGHETHHRTHFDPNVEEWCRILGSYLKEIDHYGHLISAHVSNDFNLLNPKLCAMPQMDINLLDAYNNRFPDTPERIIDLIVGTAKAGAAYNKPIFITEFGGSAMATGLENLKIEHHLGIWAGACTPMGGVPMFWWWQVIDENNLYERYPPLVTFMQDVDPRNPQAQLAAITLGQTEKAEDRIAQQFGVVCTAAPDQARGFIYPKRFARTGEKPPVGEYLTLNLPNCTPGLYRIEFYETQKGKLTRRFDARATSTELSFTIPKFVSDCAFKAQLITSIAPKP